MEIRPQHECEDDAGFSLQNVCPDGTVGASDIFILIAIVILLAAGGYALWLWMRRRHSD